MSSDAIQRWESLISSRPVFPDAYVGAARAYRAAGRMQDASQVLQDAQAQFPDYPAIFVDWATIAVEQADWREALRRLQTVRERFADLPLGYAAAGHAWRHLGECDEADAVTDAGLARLPDHFELLTSHAWTAMVRQNWPQAEQRWRTLLARHPLSGHGYVGLAEAFRIQQRHDDAEIILRAGMLILPDVAPIAEAFAMAATQRQDWPAAAQRWGEVHERFPGSAVSCLQFAIALKQIDAADKAEAVLEQGMRLLPGDAPLAIEHAWCANVRNDWPEAERRWQSLSERFPASIAIQEGLVNARLGAAAASGLPHRVNAPIPKARKAPAAGERPDDLLAHFEGLGQNCEFGLVQRHFGIEPISLFRWVAISMQSLADALEHRLAGIGDPAQTVLGCSPGHEYFVTDTKYQFTMHTFVQRETIGERQFLDQQCRRLVFLSAKLLEELASNEKIFVFFQGGPVDQAKLSRLHGALRRQADVTLLNVRPSDPAHAPGTVEQTGPGLLVGYIERFGNRIDGIWDIAYDNWLQICREAHRLTS